MELIAISICLLALVMLRHVWQQREFLEINWCNHFMIKADWNDRLNKKASETFASEDFAKEGE